MITRFIACGVAVVVSAGCSNDCETLCEDVTDCRSYCDPGVEDCSDKGAEEAAREADYEDCVSECEDAAEDKGERCEEAISILGDCQVRHTCGGGYSHCGGETTRYYDECFVEQAATTTCGFLCDQLEYGCLPHEVFGYRGPDCREVCIAAAKKESCAEALYAFDDCQSNAADPVVPCLQVDTQCLSKAETFVERCEGFARTTPDPDEEAFCAAAAVTICLCEEKYYPDPACEPRTTDQCLFQLWRGDACRAGWEDYVLCLESLDVCTASRETCSTGARFDACRSDE